MKICFKKYNLNMYILGFKMKRIEEFFKNRISFISRNQSPHAPYMTEYFSNNIFEPESYNFDLLKKIISFCYYLMTELERTGNEISVTIEISLYLPDYYGSTDPIVGFSTHDAYENCLVMMIKQEINELNYLPFYTIPAEPFKIMVTVTDNLKRRNFLFHLKEKEEAFKRISNQINGAHSFKSDECVICLTNPLNVLFCNCGHLCLCVECDEVKNLVNCPVCKTENTIKRILE